MHPDPTCLDAAERRRAFPRALRHAGPLDLTDLHAYLVAVRCSPAGDPSGQSTLPAPSKPKAGLIPDEHPMSSQQ